MMAINTMNGLVYVFKTGTNIQIAPETKVDAKMTRADVKGVTDSCCTRRHLPIRYRKQNHNVEYPCLIPSVGLMRSPKLNNREMIRMYLIDDLVIRLAKLFNTGASKRSPRYDSINQNLKSRAANECE